MGREGFRLHSRNTVAVRIWGLRLLLTVATPSRHVGKLINLAVESCRPHKSICVAFSHFLLTTTREVCFVVCWRRCFGGAGGIEATSAEFQSYFIRAYLTASQRTLLTPFNRRLLTLCKAGQLWVYASNPLSNLVCAGMLLSFLTSLHTGFQVSHNGRTRQCLGNVRDRARRIQCRCGGCLGNHRLHVV